MMQNRGWGALGALGVAAVVGLSVGTASVSASATKTQVKKPAAKSVSPAAMIAKGKSLVTASGCAGCHKIGGKGGTTGPDLSHVGKQMTAAEIGAKIKNPKAKNPNSIMPASPRPAGEISDMAAYLASLK